MSVTVTLVKLEALTAITADLTAAVAGSASAAAASATLASQWATKTDGVIPSTAEFSAKEYAQGVQAATGGSSKNWAQQTGADVTGAAANSRSAKSWAQDALTGATLGGSSKDWATNTAVAVDGTSFSAKEYAQGTQAGTGGSAKDWASKTAAAVAGGEFSAKEFAIGTQAATGGSAKNWATQTGADVTGAAANARSAKSWAQEQIVGATLGGSAKDWAQHTAAAVDGTNFSAKEHAIGTQAGTGGSAKNWAQQTAADVTGAAANSRSAKSWAQDNLAGATLGGSAKDWAQSGSLPDGTNKSAKSYASDAGTSAAAAAASASTAAAIAAGLNYKGTVAGASVAATSTAAGDCYVISSAGTSQSKTWAAGDLAIYRGSSGQWDQIPASVVLGIAAALKNTLTPRPGILFDGRTTAHGRVTMTNQAIATDNFSVTMTFRVPTAAPANSIGLFGMSSSGAYNIARGIYGYFQASGTQLNIQLNGALAADARTAVVAGFITSYAGEVVNLSVVRSASGLAIYANGVALSFTEVTSGSPPAFTDTITNTVMLVGAIDTGNYAYSSEIYSFSFYNLALTASEVIEINRMNGAVPSRYQFGNQNTYLSDFTVGADSWAATAGNAAGNIDTINGKDDVLRYYANASNTAHAVSRTLASARQRRFRLRGDIYVPTGMTTLSSVWFMMGSSNDTPATWIANSGAKSWTPNAAWQAIDLDMTVTPWFTAPSLTFYANNGSLFAGANSTTDDVFYLSALRLTQLGAVVHYSADDGIGRQLRDSSPNKLHLSISGLGNEHTIERDDGRYVQFGITANGELLDTAGVLRTDAVLLDVIVKNTTANAVSGFGIGMSSGVRDLTYETDIPANSTVVLPIKRADLVGLTLGTVSSISTVYGRVYYSAFSWNSGILNISIRYRRERDL